MKRPIFIIAILIAITLIILFVIDAKLYYYGKNDWEVHDKLPFKIIPKYWGYDYGNLGFVLEENGEAAIAKGVRYWGYPNIHINEILKYGFNKEKILVLINDSLGKEYYVTFIKDLDLHSHHDSKVAMVPKDSLINKENLKWIDIKNVTTDPIELARNYFEILLLVLIFILTRYLLKQRKNKKEVS